MNLPPFPLDCRNHDEQRTSPTNIPADAECSLRQRGLQEIYRKEKAAEKNAAQVDSLRCCAVALFVLVLLIVLLVKGCSGSDPLTGTWDYDSNTTYQFDGKGSGAMLLTSATYDFSYQVKDDQLFIDFSNEAARDCTYTFSVNDNTLTLTGGEGTIGGTYELHRQEE